MNAHQSPNALPLEDARRIVEDHAGRLAAAATERVRLLDACGRILAQDVRADRDFPPFSRATRDGFAVRAQDTQSRPAKLRVVAEIAAGQCGNLHLGPGEAAEIMTGAPVPPGADAIVMVEYSSRDKDSVTIQRGADVGENIVAQGAEAKAGDTLLARGQKLNHASIAVAAAIGATELQTYVRPRIAILATGDELVDVSAIPGPAQIRNSNSYSLAAQVIQCGGEAVILPPSPDHPERLGALFFEGLSSELLLISGGVSMGKYDLVEKVLSQLNAEFFFTGVLIQPGKPAVFGRVRDKYFLGLPGNPVSTMVTFELFARPLIEGLSGATPEKLRFVQARLKADISVKTGLTRFLPALLTGEYHSALVELLPWKGSGDVAATARANCYIVVPRNRDHIFADELVDVLPMSLR